MFSRPCVGRSLTIANRIRPLLPFTFRVIFLQQMVVEEEEEEEEEMVEYGALSLSACARLPARPAACGGRRPRPPSCLPLLGSYLCCASHPRTAQSSQSMSQFARYRLPSAPSLPPSRTLYPSCSSSPPANRTELSSGHPVRLRGGRAGSRQGDLPKRQQRLKDNQLNLSLSFPVILSAGDRGCYRSGRDFRSPFSYPIITAESERAIRARAHTRKRTDLGRLLL